MHLILPPVVGSYFALCAVLLYWKRFKLQSIARASLTVLVACFVAGVYVPLIHSALFNGPPLIDNLPPVTGMLSLIMLSVFLFLPPNRATRLNFRVFIPLALPPALYLLFNPDELITPRGIDLFLTFGPLILATTAIAGYIADLWAKMIKYRTEARYDGLTGLFQRSAGREQINQALTEGTSLGALFLDMNNLKPINDRFGHEAGDRALRHLSDVVKAVARPQDVAIRWGGDEFLLIIQQTDDSRLQRVTAAMEQALANHADTQLNISASIGGALTQPGDDVDSLIDRADEAMYQEKKRSRSRLAPGH
ncbi:MAG: diguanylate cyclase [Pseudomonadota bacterium]